MSGYPDATNDRVEIASLAALAPRAYRSNGDVSGRCAHIREGPLRQSPSSGGTVGVQLPDGLSNCVAQHLLLYRNARMPTAAGDSSPGLHRRAGDPTHLGRMRQLCPFPSLFGLCTPCGGVVLLRWKPLRLTYM